MSTDIKYELAIAECKSLRQQLKDTYNKCSSIYEALSILDEYSTNERTILERLITDLKQTIRNELEKNTDLYMEKLQSQHKEKHLKQELNDKTKDLNKVMIKYRRIYLNQQQEQFIQENRISRMKK
jgi:hypothetical protein